MSLFFCGGGGRSSKNVLANISVLYNTSVYFFTECVYDMMVWELLEHYFRDYKLYGNHSKASLLSNVSWLLELLDVWIAIIEVSDVIVALADFVTYSL